MSTGNDELAAELARCHAAARDEWPEVVVERDELVRYVTERLPDGDPVAALAQLNTSQLYLACACARGDATALRAFERTCAPVIGAALSQLRALGADAEDVAQLVLQKVLVGDGDRRARILDYNGSGELRSWLKAVALREGLSFLRKRKREVLANDDDIWMAVSVDALAPGFRELRNRYRVHFKDALPRAIAALPHQERALLRYHYLDGLNLEQVGKIYGVHRSTASRWVERACTQLVEHLRALLRDALGVSEAELDSIVAMIRSELEVSLTGYFAAAARIS